MNELINFTKDVRSITLKMNSNANASHSGSALSIVEILTVLYKRVLNIDPENPLLESRDYFFLSKGHACSSLYATLYKIGFFKNDIIADYSKEGSIFTTHANHYVPGIELSTGSLGHALSVACGIALSKKRKKEKNRCFVLVSDGELNEGSNWETILFAPQHKLNNLILIIDYNKIQSLGKVSDIINLESLSDKLKAFNWNTFEVDGHDMNELENCLNLVNSSNKPTAIIANTTKGKGVDFMEDNNLWHYKSPNHEELTLALKQIENK